VFRFNNGLKVYLHREPVDFRAGINGLSILVEQAMALNPMAHCRSHLMRPCRGR
jgi:transposase